MGKIFDRIDDKLAAWIAGQRLFFVATAPSEGGHVNVSPKGPISTLAVLGNCNKAGPATKPTRLSVSTTRPPSQKVRPDRRGSSRHHSISPPKKACQAQAML